jgi:hypothetical protein
MALSGQNPIVSEAWQRVTDLGADAFWMGLGYPVYRVWLVLRRLFHSPKRNAWEDSEHLFVPVLANQEIDMREAPVQIAKMQAQNCVFTAENVGIHKAAILLTLGALIFGLIAGSGAAWIVLTNVQDAGQARAMAFGLAVLSIAIFALPVALYCSYGIALFNTCLYLWGMRVREARKGESSASTAVPEPLAVALGIRSGR